MPASFADERRVTLVLCAADGSVLGRLPEPVVVTPRWWPEVDSVVAAVRGRFGLDVTVLRLLTTDTDHAGGSVTYLAQLRSGSPTRLAPPSGDAVAALDGDAAHRSWWAEAGGLDDLPAWVDAALSAHGRARTGALRQRKTWNLSVVLTAPTDAGEVWFKATPPFLADEGGVIRRVAAADPDLVPVVLAHDPGRRAILMDDVPGQDEFGLTDETVAEAMVRRWVAVQAALVDDVEHALAVGARDLRPNPLLAEVRSLVGRAEVRADLSAFELDALDALVDGLPGRLAEIAACGLPDTVLHGDLHPGNWRRSGERLTLLDWGDVGVGNPMVDQRAFVERLADPVGRDHLSALWARLWSERAPGSDPARAAYLLGPVSQLAAAAMYQRFLDHIETTERVYHALDPADRLRSAVRSASGEEDR